MIALIDGDSIAFILGWVHKDHQNVNEMHQSIDTFLDNIFTMTGADMYYGALASKLQCFRYCVYNVKPYKGNRKEQSEIMDFWRPVVTDYLQSKWKFELALHSQFPMCNPPSINADVLEADDLIYTAALSLKVEEQEFTICSIDKDLKQIPGIHFNYRSNEFCIVHTHQADYNFFKLMLEGDDTDNIAGIPGFGPKKAEEKLKFLASIQADRIAYENCVKDLYNRHFGRHYGEIIYEETYKTVSLVWDHERKIEIHAVPKRDSPFEIMNQSH